jgi:hypothetical protein
VGGFYAYQTFGPPASTVAPDDQQVEAEAPPLEEPAPAALLPITLVQYGDGSRTLGDFRYEAGQMWGEYTLEGKRTFGFERRGGTADRIEFYDASRNAWLALDFASGRVQFRLGADAYQDSYVIAGTERIPEAEMPKPRIVSMAANGAVIGTLRRESSPTVWGEFDGQGRRIFTFETRAESATLIEMYDASRDFTLRVDFIRSVVELRHANGPFGVIYEIAGVVRE